MSGYFVRAWADFNVGAHGYAPLLTAPGPPPSFLRCWIGWAALATLVSICMAVTSHAESPGANKPTVDKAVQLKRKVIRLPFKPLLVRYLGKSFEIKVETYHPGDRWEAFYDKDFLRLDGVRPNYEWKPPYGLLRLGSVGSWPDLFPRPRPEGRLVGGEIFVFVPSREGHTTISFSRKKPLEKSAAGGISYWAVIRP
jgi:hypothetical protein